VDLVLLAQAARLIYIRSQPDRRSVTRQYYVYRYRLDGNEAFLIWYSNQVDGLHVDAAGVVPVFTTARDLADYATQHGITLASLEPGFADLDPVARWLGNPDSDQVNPSMFKDAWNLFSDLSNSIGGDFDADKDLTQGIYDKLFWGCNLPAMTPEGKAYEPLWDDSEIEIMSGTLAHGLTMFRKALACDAPTTLS